MGAQDTAGLRTACGGEGQTLAGTQVRRRKNSSCGKEIKVVGRGIGQWKEGEGTRMETCSTVFSLLFSSVSSYSSWASDSTKP